MSKRDLNKREETIREMPDVSTDATAAFEEETMSLRIRTYIRAGAGSDWQSVLEGSEGDPMSL